MEYILTEINANNSKNKRKSKLEYYKRIKELVERATGTRIKTIMDEPLILKNESANIIRSWGENMFEISQIYQEHLK